MKWMQSGRKLRRAGVRAGLVFCACVLAQWSAWAESVSGEAQLPALAQRWIERALAEQARTMDPPLTLRATLGALDGRLRLAPCARVEAYVPVGSRLWGQTRIGLRCLEGTTRWNVFLPVKVHATGMAWVLRRDVPAATVLDEADLMRAEVDWAAEASPVLATRQAWVGQVAARSLSFGQALRQNMVRPAQVFQAGAQIRVLVHGGGFQIAALAQAVSPGFVGQQARVRMDNGQILSGVVLDARTVRLEL